MSGQKAAWVVCDGCGEQVPSKQNRDDVGTSTVTGARREAARQGWSSRLGRDWCPDCRKRLHV